MKEYKKPVNLKKKKKANKPKIIQNNFPQTQGQKPLQRPEQAVTQAEAAVTALGTKCSGAPPG